MYTYIHTYIYSNALGMHIFIYKCIGIDMYVPIYIYVHTRRIQGLRGSRDVSNSFRV